MKKYLYIIIASICTGMAFAGIFLPVLPTTPLLLLALWLYMRSSKSGVKMLLSNKHLAPYIKSYFSRKGIPKQQLRKILLTLWLTLGVCMAIVHTRLYLIALLTIIGTGVTIHLHCKREKTN